MYAYTAGHARFMTALRLAFAVDDPLAASRIRSQLVWVIDGFDRVFMPSSAERGLRNVRKPTGPIGRNLRKREKSRPCSRCEDVGGPP
jgi:hypothetical protein